MNRREAFNKAMRGLKGSDKPRGFEIKNLTNGTPEVYIYGDIAEWEVNALDIVNELQTLNGVPFDLHINSYGGSVYEGIAIYNAIQRYPADVTVYVDGIAASAASFIAMAGSKVIIGKQAEMMIHDALTGYIGNAKDFKAVAEELDKMSDNIASIYVDKAGGTVEEWRARMDVESVYTGQEAVDVGLADEVYGEAAPENKSVMSGLLQASAPPVAVDDEFAWLSEVDLTSALTIAFKEAS